MANAGVGAGASEGLELDPSGGAGAEPPLGCLGRSPQKLKSSLIGFKMLVKAFFHNINGKTCHLEQSCNKKTIVQEKNRT